MDIGMLWFDSDPRTTLVEKVLRAAAYYEKKHGHAPNLCFVHPSAFSADGLKGKKKVKAGNVEVRPGRSVLQHHFWLGQKKNKST